MSHLGPHLGCPTRRLTCRSKALGSPDRVTGSLWGSQCVKQEEKRNIHWNGTPMGQNAGSTPQSAMRYVGDEAKRYQHWHLIASLLPKWKSGAMGWCSVPSHAGAPASNAAAAPETARPVLLVTASVCRNPVATQLLTVQSKLLCPRSACKSSHDAAAFVVPA